MRLPLRLFFRLPAVLVYFGFLSIYHTTREMGVGRYCGDSVDNRFPMGSCVLGGMVGRRGGGEDVWLICVVLIYLVYSPAGGTGRQGEERRKTVVEDRARKCGMKSGDDSVLQRRVGGFTFSGGRVGCLHKIFSSNSRVVSRYFVRMISSVVKWRRWDRVGGVSSHRGQRLPYITFYPFDNIIARYVKENIDVPYVVLEEALEGKICFRFNTMEGDKE
ncbi:hypothetical protein HNY73_022532 [Argiope bruennichi]|uniref:Uncharacterized protein n=1 Tax=Argiope bruennichi TaxID=94029 RepID=A0A8T0E5F5_ARGBR|nr:hypothetical protein HNY73_022532 [Argiope bruennichi]